MAMPQIPFEHAEVVISHDFPQLNEILLYGGPRLDETINRK